MTALEKLIRTASNDPAEHYRELAKEAYKEYEDLARLALSIGQEILRCPSCGSGDIRKHEHFGTQCQRCGQLFVAHPPHSEVLSPCPPVNSVDK